MRPEKVGSQEKKGSDEEDDSEGKKEEIKDKGKGKIGDKKEEEISDGCKRCNKSWKDCTCQCRKHGNILDCGIEYNEECYYITALNPKYPIIINKYLAEAMPN